MSNLFVSGLPAHVGDDALRSFFEPYGPITSAKVMLDVTTGASRGYGFVLYSTPEAGAAAVTALNRANVTFGGVTSMLQVMPSLHDGRVGSNPSPEIFVRNIPASVPDAELSLFFAQFGRVVSMEVSVVVAQPHLRKAHVEFESIDAARECIQATHGRMVFKPCTVNILSKFADSTDTKNARRVRKQQQQRPQSQTTQAAGGGGGASPGSSLPSTIGGASMGATGAPPLARPPFVPGFPATLGASTPLGGSSWLAGGGQSLGTSHMGGASSSLPGGSFAALGATPPSGGFSLPMPNIPPHQAATSQLIYFQGIMGITTDGQYFPIQPEVVRPVMRGLPQAQYVSEGTSSQPQHGHHVASGSSLGAIGSSSPAPGPVGSSISSLSDSLHGGASLPPGGTSTGSGVGSGMPQFHFDLGLET